MMQLLLLVADWRKEPFYFSRYNSKGRLMDCAVRAGCDVVITSWNHLRVEEGTVFADRGIMQSSAARMQIERPLPLRPKYVFMQIGRNKDGHITVYPGNVRAFTFLLGLGLIRDSGENEKSITRKYVQYLLRGYWKDTYISFCKGLDEMNKWQMEWCFVRAEKDGLAVRRPRTILEPTPQLIQSLRKAFLRCPQSLFIVKPSTGTRSEGIYLLSQRNLEEQLSSMERDGCRHFVCQEYLRENLLYRNRRTDLRLFVAVYSWEPLVFEVLREGKTRVSNSEYDPDYFEDPTQSISSHSVAKSSGAIKFNPLLEEYFNELPCENRCIWSAIEEEVGKSLRAFIAHGNLLKGGSLPRSIHLLGYDCMLVQEGGTCVPHIIEMNAYPQYYRDEGSDPSNRLNPLLDGVFTGFFTKVRETVGH
ncbi:MAG TPA: hypothetical protein VJB10_02155 [Candidatus Peribacteraceae bacterium]|nr:hypothetical protein [Candidatus Peribacteraceae bacterium]